MVAVDAHRFRIVGVSRAAEEERILALAEDEELAELLAEALGGQGRRGEEENRERQESTAHESSGEDGRRVGQLQSRASGAFPQRHGRRARAGAVASP